MMTLRRPPRRGFGEQPATLAAIQNLFARGEQGGYWPADPQYAYEDSAGTIPASVNGVVGLMFDISQKMMLGPEIIVGGNMEGSLPSNISNRVAITSSTEQAQTGTYSVKAICDNQSGYHYLSFYGLTVGKCYRISLWVYIPTNDITSAFISQAGSVNQGITITSRDVWVNVNIIIFASHSSFGVTVVANSANSPAFYIDNVSVKEILGNHAIQATTANKPYLRRTPVSNKYWLDSNTYTSALTTTFASSLGSACTIATVGEEGVTIAENQTITTTYNLTPPYGYNGGVLIINRALTASEKALVTRTLKRNAPYYPSIVDARLQMRGYAPNNENTVDTSIITSFSYAWYGCSSLTSFPLINTAAGTSFYQAWNGCSGLTSFPLINTAAGTNFSYAWAYCSSLTSFPLINTAAGTTFSSTWYNCSGLTSFPLINTAAGTNFYLAWYNCSGLTSFPLINTAAGTNFSFAWRGCSGLTSFPLINTAAGTDFSYAWVYCSSLTSFPANFFDSWTGVPVSNCFLGTWGSCTKLTLASVQNIVVSLVVSGKSAPATGTDISLDGAPTLVAIQADTTVMTAVATLKSRNWTPKYKGTAL